MRAIAPYVQAKTLDPAVLVIDEQGAYCIPLLSGHLGGANELALALAAAFGMEPVVTTATDRNGKWAVDVFAKKNGLLIRDMERRNVSQRICWPEKRSGSRWRTAKKRRRSRTFISDFWNIGLATRLVSDPQDRSIRHRLPKRGVFGAD